MRLHFQGDPELSKQGAATILLGRRQGRDPAQSRRKASTHTGQSTCSDRSARYGPSRSCAFIHLRVNVKGYGRCGLAGIGESHFHSSARTPQTSTTRITTDMATSNKMHNPPHPGEVVKELCLKPLGLTVTEAAAGLGVSRKQLSAVINGRASVSPEMAVRLSMAFRTSAEVWLNHQLQYDLWVAKKQSKSLKVARFAA